MQLGEDGGQEAMFDPAELLATSVPFVDPFSFDERLFFPAYWEPAHRVSNPNVKTADEKTVSHSAPHAYQGLNQGPSLPLTQTQTHSTSMRMDLEKDASLATETRTPAGSQDPRNWQGLTPTFQTNTETHSSLQGGARSVGGGRSIETLPAARDKETSDSSGEGDKGDEGDEIETGKSVTFTPIDAKNRPGLRVGRT